MGYGRGLPVSYEHYDSVVNCANSPLVDPVGEVTIMAYGSRLGYNESVLTVD